ncbi:uncharacterized protein Triagg1_4858 [Trichoderma aggressivum f. europaeum]|uniref:Uncharacterized protein n=1 Tax=Trichoderma aggressivum f. europaeum TaxID=173218 RepID=A0AAE1IG03_9HYPO|nr:hypothetical protein Triagg1_4858 [Trichoderma aggressivum f. europaeum]
MSSASGNDEAKRPVASFIFLPDTRSSGTKLLYEIQQAFKPKTLADILGPARSVMLDPPFYDPREPGKFYDPALARRWFFTDNPIGADETATESQWKNLSCCISEIKVKVWQEANIVGRENVFLVGFGIGFAVATAFLLQMEEPIGGLFGVYPVMPFHVDLKYIALDGQTKAVVNSWPTMSDEDETRSEASAGTLDFDHGNEQTHEARRARVMGFFQYVASFWEAPTQKRYCDRLDASTPVILLHGMDDEQIPFTYAKEAAQTFWNLGYKATLDYKEGEGHGLSRNMIGEIIHHFMKHGMGKEEVRAHFANLLWDGAFTPPEVIKRPKREDSE